MNILNSNILDMDDLETHTGWIHVVVDPMKAVTVTAYTNYATAKNNCTSYTSQGFLINISPETLEKIKSGEIRELNL